MDFALNTIPLTLYQRWVCGLPTAGGQVFISISVLIARKKQVILSDY
jgi:hypothetical protein